MPSEISHEDDFTKTSCSNISCGRKIIFACCFYYHTVAKRKSLFDDKPVEIQELTYIIKQDIGSLNKQIAQLQEVRFFVL